VLVRGRICPTANGLGEAFRVVAVGVNCETTVSTIGCVAPARHFESPLYDATNEFWPAHGKVETTSVPAPGVGGLAEPSVIVPGTETVAGFAPGHVTVSVTVIGAGRRSGGSGFTPAVNVTFYPSTTGLGAASNLTTLVTCARMGTAGRKITSAAAASRSWMPENPRLIPISFCSTAIPL
jgi:hypothetical protein